MSITQRLRGLAKLVRSTRMFEFEQTMDGNWACEMDVYGRWDHTNTDGATVPFTGYRVSEGLAKTKPGAFLDLVKQVWQELPVMEPAMLPRPSDKMPEPVTPGRPDSEADGGDDGQPTAKH